MAGTIPPNISIALYNYLCQNIVGSEDYVKQIRTVHAVGSNIASTSMMTVIASGSFGEGLELRGSDLDIMAVPNFIEVFEDVKPPFDPNVMYLSMEIDDVKPCFTQLKLEKNIHPMDLQCYEEHNGKYYFSSGLQKQKMLQFIWDNAKEEGIIHGPCISDESGYVDSALSLHCKTWISSAVHWITRSSNSWPSHNVKKSIIKHGVLFVPIGVKCSPKEHLEWRVSFSVGEKLLINSFTHTQLLCYALLKIVLKDIIGTYSECKDLLCSYFLKTIMFWVSEELPQSIWKPDNIVPCFMRCFRRLIYCVEHSVCLHYFIPENNMFENKIEGRSREILLEKLFTLHSYDWRCILFSDQISNFHSSSGNFNIETHTVYAKLLNSQVLPCVNCIFDSVFKIALMFDLFQTIKQLSFQKSSIKDLYKYYMSKTCHRLVQSVSFDNSFCDNKYNYEQYRFCLSILLQNVYHDAVSGWLMVASFFYKTKQYQKALYIIMYSISKCTPEKLYVNMTMSDIHYQMLNLRSIKKMSFGCLLKIMFVDDIKCERISMLTPDELQIGDMNTINWVPPTVYAYFLNFLCHYHLKNFRQCQASLQVLKLVIDEQYLMARFNLKLKAKAYNLLGIALLLFGDKESARQAFVQSVELFPNEKYNYAVRILSMMSLK